MHLRVNWNTVRHTLHGFFKTFRTLLKRGIIFLGEVDHAFSYPPDPALSRVVQEKMGITGESPSLRWSIEAGTCFFDEEI
jgi:hypothetical protein